jgi:hypothetical protein
MNKLLFFLVAVGFTGGNVIAEEQIRRIQEELRKRNLYFGEIDGQKTEETTRALRHYQKRKGFTATGEPDLDTLSALNLTEPMENRAPWPEVAVLKSDAARRFKEEDRKYLESLAPIAEGPAVDEITLAVPEPAPATVALPAKADASAPKKDVNLPVDTLPAVSPERAEEFVRQYLDACETNQLEMETAYYADKVRYFDHGVVDRAFIEQDVAAFYKRWPTRSYHLFDFKVLQSRGDEAVVKFRISFQYRSPKHRVAGKTDNVFTIQRNGERMRFTSLREQRLRD